MSDSTSPVNQPASFSLNAALRVNASRLNSLLVFMTVLSATIFTIKNLLVWQVGFNGIMFFTWLSGLCSILILPLAACILIAILTGPRKQRPGPTGHV